MKLIWIDIETSGLDPDRDFILEVAAHPAWLETAFDLDPEAGNVDSVVGDYGTPETILRRMEPFVREMHTKNGLIDAALRAAMDPAKRLVKIEDQLIALLGPPPASKEDKPILAGSSVHFDLAFVRAHMHRLATMISHRVYDVSAIKLFCQSLGMPKIPKGEAHRAWKDVLESVDHAKKCRDWLASHFGGLPRTSETRS